MDGFLLLINEELLHIVIFTFNTKALEAESE